MYEMTYFQKQTNLIGHIQWSTILPLLLIPPWALVIAYRLPTAWPSIVLGAHMLSHHEYGTGPWGPAAFWLWARGRVHIHDG